MRFTKMEGAGNDYVYVDCFREPAPEDPADLARKISDRHFGVGGDGLILMLPSEVADARMRMFNADGSEGEMCGNGVRCVAKYVYDHGLCRRPTLKVETSNGVLQLELHTQGGVVDRVRVNMGRPKLAAAEIPTTLPGEPVVDAPLDVGGRPLRVTAVSTGNPHCIVYVDRLSDDWVLGVGPELERHPAFPKRANVEFVEVVKPDEVRMRVWERGSGETLACGTGASAVCVAGVLTGRTARRIRAHLPGGVLELEWADDNQIYMTGPAVEVFSGEWTPPAASPPAWAAFGR
jgi:diaminopimelate epimerase